MPASTWTTIGLVSLIAVGLALMGRRSASGQRIWQSLAIRAPLFGELIRSNQFADTARAISLMVEAGAPLQTAFKLAAGGPTSAATGVLNRLVEATEQGEPILDQLTRESIPDAFLQMARVADQTNTWATSMASAAALLDQEVRIRQERLLTLLTPAVTLIAGGLMGVTMVSIVTALLDLNQLVLP